MRVGRLAPSDIKALEERVRPQNHPDIPKDALVVTCTNKEVNRINEERLANIQEKEYEFQSINKLNTQRNFQPRVKASGAVSGTPLQKLLKLKVKAKVMLTYNIDTCDSLTNGAFGEVVGLDLDSNGQMKEVFVHFFNPECGQEARKNLMILQKRFPGKNVIGIKPIEF